MNPTVTMLCDCGGATDWYEDLCDSTNKALIFLSYLTSTRKFAFYSVPKKH
jgi:hypothetical protein